MAIKRNQLDSSFISDVRSEIAGYDATSDLINNQYVAIKGRDGMYLETYLDGSLINKAVENITNCLAQINGCMREAPFMENVQDWFQRDRLDDAYPVKGGILQPAYKPYYGELVDSWDAKKLVGATPRGISWDSTRRCWWVATGASKTIVRVDEKFQNILGWWTLNGMAAASGVLVDGNTLYTSDESFSTNGRVTKHTISTDGSLVYDGATGFPSGSVLTVTTSLAGDGTNYKNTYGMCTDGTYIYVNCWGVTKVGVITKSSFTWTSNFSVTSYCAASSNYSLCYLNNHLFISDYGTYVTEIAVDGSLGYHKFSGAYYLGLTTKDGDIYGVNGGIIEKRAIKNTRTLEGQIIGTWKQPNTSETIYDMTWIANLLGSGVHGFMSVANDLRIRVWTEAFVEVTSLTNGVATTLCTTSAGVASLNAISNDGTYLYIVGKNATQSIVLKIAITRVNTSCVLAAADISIVGAVASNNYTGIDVIPNTSGAKVLLYNQVTTSGAWTHTLSLGGTGTTAQAFGNMFGWTPSCAIWFKNSRELYVHNYGAGTGQPSTVVVDWQMSQYMGANQPYIIKVLSMMNYADNTFPLAGDSTGNIYTIHAGTTDLIHKLASASASDSAITGKDKRNVRYYGSVSTAAAIKTYPGLNFASQLVVKVIRYRRKYASSVYSSQNNVLPLDGLYVLTQAGGLTIIDLESNTEFMTFNRPETAANFNILDIQGAANTTFNDMYVIDDKVYIGAVVGLFTIDFINDTAYATDTADTYKYQKSLKDRNMSGGAGTFATYWGTSLNGSLEVVNGTVISVHAKQDTTIKPEEHNGTVIAVDNGEIYIAYGTTAGDGLIKWKAGVSFARATSNAFKLKISDSWNLVGSFVQNVGGAIWITGDIRKIYTNSATVSWDTQVGYTYKVWGSGGTAIANNYINDFDVKTIYRNGVAYNYIAVAMGQVGTSSTQAVQIIDVVNNKIETLETFATNIYGRLGICFSDKYLFWGATDGAGNGYLKMSSRVDYISSTGGNTNWTTRQISSTDSEYYQLADDIRSVTFSHNTICIANDKGVQIIELPRQDSFIQGISQTLQPSLPQKVFLEKNDYVKPTIFGSAKERVRNIFSDATDAKYTYVAGSVNAWSAIQVDAAKFGGNYKYVQGQSAGGTQPKVSWTPVSNCKQIIIYAIKSTNQGLMDINYVDSVEGAKTFVYDLYSAEAVQQDQIVLSASVTGFITSVEMVGKTTKNAASGDYYMSLQGCVEISETSNTYANGSIKYEVSFDSGVTWQDISSVDMYNKVDINHTPNGTCIVRETFTVGNSEDMYINDFAVIFG